MRSAEVAARYNEFIWVYCGDKRTAQRVGAPGGGANLIFLDPDGERYFVKNVQRGGVESILEAIEKSHEKFANKEIAWTEPESVELGEESQGKLFVYAFVDDGEASTKVLKALEDRWIAKDHDRMVFVKVTDAEGPLASRFKVSSVPTLIFFDPTLSEYKQIMKKKTGEVGPLALKRFVSGCFETMKREQAKAQR